MNISGKNNSIYTLDTLSGVSYGVIVSKDNCGLDCRNADSVLGLTVSASQPSGTEIYFAFSTGDSWFALNTAGSPVTISSSVPSFALLQSKGNTVSQLRALTNIPAFAHNLVRTAIAVSSSDPQNVIPSAKISANCSVTNQTLSFTEYSPVFSLGDNAVISAIPYEKVLSNGGTVTVTGKITRDDDTESEWLPPEMIAGSSAKAIQLRCTYYAQNPGVSSAKLSQLNVSYYRNVSGAPLSEGRIYSLTEDWYMDIKSARINIRHSPLDQSTMKVYAAFRKSPGHAVKESLGIAPASRKTYQLSHPNGIKYDTLKIYIDGQEIFTGFELNGEVGRVTLTAPEGSIITASYSYGWDKEIWRELALSSRVSLEDYDMSEYRTILADQAVLEREHYTAAAFLIETKGTTGHATNESLGVSKGSMQTVKLAHRAVSLPAVTADNASISSKNFVLLDGSRLLRFAAPAGKTIRASYNWQSEPVQIFQVTASFTD